MFVRDDWQRVHELNVDCHGALYVCLEEFTVEPVDFNLAEWRLYFKNHESRQTSLHLRPWRKVALRILQPAGRFEFVCGVRDARKRASHSCTHAYFHTIFQN